VAFTDILITDQSRRRRRAGPQAAGLAAISPCATLSRIALSPACRKPIIYRIRLITSFWVGAATSGRARCCGSFRIAR
jgi:hypothetical protein